MVKDIGYIKRVTKRILTLVLSLIRDISCIQNGSILHAIFDCVYHSPYGRTNDKGTCKKNRTCKKGKRNNCTSFSFWNNCRTTYMGDNCTYR